MTDDARKKALALYEGDPDAGLTIEQIAAEIAALSQQGCGIAGTVEAALRRAYLRGQMTSLQPAPVGGDISAEAWEVIDENACKNYREHSRRKVVQTINKEDFLEYWYVKAALEYYRVCALSSPPADEKLREAVRWIPAEEWNEDQGFALWTRFPVNEPYYAGSPICDDWPGYHTHYIPMSVFRHLLDKDGNPIAACGGE